MIILNESIVEQKCRQLIFQTLEQKGTDIFFKPEKEIYNVYVKIFGQIQLKQKLPTELAERMISFLKYQASLDIGEKRKPQSGALSLHNEKISVHCRISTLPTIFNLESIVIRIYQNEVALPLTMLTGDQASIEQIQKFSTLTQGILFFTGATGSGKTTTIYSFLQHILQQEHKQVISLEDPVEQQYTNLIQVQINEKANITFESGLKAILRHSPDIIVLGECRDLETTRIAIEAALTGHLVIATFHAKNCLGCLRRLLDFGFSREQLRQAIAGVIAQQLFYEQNTAEVKFQILTEVEVIECLQKI